MEEKNQKLEKSEGAIQEEHSKASASKKKQITTKKDVKPSEPKKVVTEEKHPAEKVKKARKPKKKMVKVVVARGKRKESIARATIKEGKGNIRINKISTNALSSRYIRELILEPLAFVGPEANSIDINVSVFGGGMMGQAQAARTAIANALVQYFDGMNLKEKFLQADRMLLIEDVRRVEPKKFRGPKARARYQKSYR